MWFLKLFIAQPLQQKSFGLGVVKNYLRLYLVPNTTNVLAHSHIHPTHNCHFFQQIILFLYLHNINLKVFVGIVVGIEDVLCWKVITW